MFIAVSILLFSLTQLSSTYEIRCYSSLKYHALQETYQDTENCSPIMGLGEPYCYKFMEETKLNEVVKMGCSSVLCNSIRNRCMETDLLGMKGTICCCNDRHYCNSTRLGNNFMTVIILLIIAICWNFE